MYRYKGKPSHPWLGILAILFPILTIVLFHILKQHTQIMNFWVFHCMAPVMGFFGRFWGLFSFSVAELLIAVVLLSTAFLLLQGAILWWRQHTFSYFLRRLAAVLCLGLWLWSGLCWLWNCTYYADSFTKRSGLSAQSYSLDALIKTTEHFAQHAALLSSHVPRDAQLHFAASHKDCLNAGIAVYDNLQTMLPSLEQPSTRAKPLLFSRLQSRMGFTGLYFPFTGEANVNVDAPLCLFPATIAHEMSHQRMVAAEEEANFVGILACVTSEDVTFQYSGYLLGLIHLSNALFSVSPESLYAIMDEHFTPELSTDWADNNAYWKQLESPVEELAESTYDSYLVQNNQELGIRSYGACVDLLVTYF